MGRNESKKTGHSDTMRVRNNALRLNETPLHFANPHEMATLYHFSNILACFVSIALSLEHVYAI